jgi:hypothetical protein
MNPASSVSSQSANLRERVVVFAMCLLATMHLVWFYLNRVPTYLNLERYESGAERMPFQGRPLMEYPLRWAHGSSLCGHAAAFLTSLHMWLPRGVLPEDIVEFAVDLPALAVAGLVARDLYRGQSRSGRFTAFVYPLVLAMVALAYCLETAHFFRFVYDLPSLGLFSCGLYLIYRRRHPALLAALFVVATLNRETSIFLLFFFLASACTEGEKFSWRHVLTWRVGGLAALLTAFWLGWHVWVARHFAGLPTEATTHVGVNLMAIFWPLEWPQLFGIGAYTLPLVLLLRKTPRSAELRAWMWMLPLWGLFMLVFGLVFEIRLFGELIPLFACMAALLADDRWDFRVETKLGVETGLDMGWKAGV